MITGVSLQDRFGSGPLFFFPSTASKTNHDGRHDKSHVITSRIKAFGSRSPEASLFPFVLT